MKKDKGITLIALIITIIVLLILAGITISLVIGDNGILNKAQNAGEEYIKASIKEEIELGITDISAELASKTPPESMTKQAVIDKIKERMQESIIIREDLTGEYKGYEYWIDDDYVVHIGNKVNPTIALTAKVEKIGTSYFTLSAQASSNQGAITGYLYTIDGVEKPITTETTYTVSDLQENSQHTAKVKAIDEKGNIKESQTFKITTEKRTYLYHAGEEYTDITGSWIKAVSSSKGYASKESDHIYINCPVERYMYTTYSLKTTSPIQLQDYTKIKALIKVEQVNNARIAIGLYDNEYDYYANYIIGPQAVVAAYADRAGDVTEISADIPKDTKPLYAYVEGRAGGDVNDHITARIYALWLEK